MGRAITAVVILSEGKALTLEEVRAFCRGQIAGYKIPKELGIVDAIPKNAKGTVMKRELRERFLQ